MSGPVDPLQISGVAKPISGLFSADRQFTVEYYQREYAWTTTNVEELINDLARSFLSNYRDGHPRSKGAEYNPYFLGPIVTYTTAGLSYLVDGQQRVTTLSLLLMFLRQISDVKDDQQGQLQERVYFNKFGENTFRMTVDDRAVVMTALLQGVSVKPDFMDASSETIWWRYQDIVRLFPEELTGKVLPHFVDWLMNRVILVEINTPDKNMALEIFESMNDRGLQLSNMDMLKSFILSRIEIPERIEAANKVWRDIVNELSEVQKNGDAEFMKTLLRAKYAQTVRESGQGKGPKDFEDINTALHKWVREQVERANAGLPDDGERGQGLELKSQADFERFVLQDMRIQSRRYVKLLHVSNSFTSGWEHVYYNAKNDFTLQYLVCLAASDVSDDDEVFRSKTELITKFIDVMVARRMANFKRTGYATMYRAMFGLAKQVRGLSVDGLKSLLSERAAGLEEKFDGLDRYSLTSMNKPDVYYLLARMTSWLDGDLTDKYLKGGSAAEPFEVEHVWASKFERHTDEFSNENDFQQVRNKFGGLLLLPKSFNASFGALPYSEKVTHYVGQNTLAQTLAQGIGTHNPNLARKAAELSVSIEAYPEQFKKADIDSRQTLYRAICEAIWDLESLGF